jgi:predicted helicase
MSAPQRDELLAWIKADVEDGNCKILHQCTLFGGVDVPSLDAVLFLLPKFSG